MQKQVLLLSSTVMYGEPPLEWCKDILKSFLSQYNVNKLLFIPYAVRDCDAYAKRMMESIQNQGVEVESIHEKQDPVAAINECKGVFVGGGNTFLLLKRLYENNLLGPIREAVLKRGVPYVGSSAGTNVATRSINCTNDMPICYPPSFEALGLVPFNINPHYLDPDPNTLHMGETRPQRIEEYLLESDSASVLGLKEGIALKVEGDKAVLVGCTSAKLFQKGKEPVEYMPGDDLSFLLEDQ